jgi:hypothetical protein
MLKVNAPHTTPGSLEFPMNSGKVHVQIHNYGNIRTYGL